MDKRHVLHIKEWMCDMYDQIKIKECKSLEELKERVAVYTTCFSKTLDLISKKDPQTADLLNSIYTNFYK